MWNWNLNWKLSLNIVFVPAIFEKVWHYKLLRFKRNSKFALDVHSSVWQIHFIICFHQQLSFKEPDNNFNFECENNFNTSSCWMRGVETFKTNYYRFKWKPNFSTCFLNHFQLNKNAKFKAFNLIKWRYFKFFLTSRAIGSC